MVHKKYTYKKGKRFGPYYYETKRVDGKVVTTYLGKKNPEKKFNHKKIIYPLVVVFILGVLLLNYSVKNQDSISENNYASILAENVKGFLTGLVVDDESPEVIGEVLNEDSVESSEEDKSSDTAESADEVLDENLEEPLEEVQSEDVVEVVESGEGEVVDNGQSVDIVISENDTQVESGVDVDLGNETLVENETVIIEENETIALDENETEISDGIISVYIDENVTDVLNDTNVSFGANLTEKVLVNTTQFSAVLGKPVRWFKKIEVNGTTNLTIEIPLSAGNLTIRKIARNNSDSLEFVEEIEQNESESVEIIEDEEIVPGSIGNETNNGGDGSVKEVENGTLEVEEVEQIGGNESKFVEVDTEKEKKENEDRNNEEGEKKENEDRNNEEGEKNDKGEKNDELEIEEIPDLKVSITGEVTFVSDSESKFSWKGFFERLLEFTGFVIGENLETQEIVVEISQSEEAVEIEYETEAPSLAFEEVIENGKRVGITGPDDVHYENVLLFTELSEYFNVRGSEIVKIFWEENSTYLDVYNVSDINGNGIYDYVEWIAPRLSNQTFEIIVIVKAEHLDENRTFISDIYEEVKELDGNWSEGIPSGDYVRIVFERNLTSENDITIYPRRVNSTGNETIEVYEENGTDMIATFEEIVDEEYNTVYLTNLIGEQDTFDLKILGGDVEFDHIVDPPDTTLPNVSYQGDTPANASTQAHDSIIVNLTTFDENDHYSFVDFDRDLILWHRFDDNNGSNAIDNSTYGRNGSLEGTSTIDSSGYEAPYGDVLVIDQVNRGGVEYLNVPGFNMTEDAWPNGTISFWMNTSSSVPNNWARIFSNERTNNNGFSFRFSGTTKTLETTWYDHNGVGFGLIREGTDNYTLYSGTWQFYTVTWSDQYRAQLWRNGTLLKTDSTFNGANILDANHTLTIGTDTWSPSVDNLDFQMDDLLIFNRSLTAGEIGALYNSSVNQYYRNFTGLQNNNENHIFKGYAVDSSGNVNNTLGHRTVSIGEYIEPSIDYQGDTPANASTQSHDSIVVNLTTSDDNDHYSFVDFNRDVVLWMRMDDTNSSADPIDLSTYGNNGTFAGSAKINTTGYFGSGSWHDGVGGSRIEVPYSSEITPGNQSFSVSIWFNPLTDSGTRNVIGKSHSVSPSRSWNLVVFGGSTALFQVWPANGSATQFQVSRSDTMSINTWHHMVGVFDGTQITIYLDGNQGSTTSLDNTLDADGFLGIGDAFGTNPFNGAVDDVLLFNRSLTTAEVLALYNASKDDYYSNYTSLSDSDHIFKGYAVDVLGNLNDSLDHRTVTVDTGAPTVTINFPSNASLFGPGDLALNFNVSLSENGSAHYSLDGGVNNISMLSEDEGQSRFGKEFNSTNDTMQYGSFVMNVYTNDTAGNKNYSGSRTFDYDDRAPNITYDGDTPANASSQTHTSIVVNLSSNDTNDHYSFVDFDRDLMLWMRFDDLNSSGEPIDLSTWGNNGTFNGDALVNKTGKFGNASHYDGAGDVINISDLGASLDFDASANYTWSAWIRYSGSTGTHECVFSKDPKDQGYNICITSGGVTQICEIVDGGDEASFGCTAGTKVLSTAGSWLHFAVVFNGTDDRWNIFEDGDFADSIQRTVTSDTSSKLFIGSGTDESSNTQRSKYYLKGSVDEILIFNRSLDALEIRALYNSSVNKYYRNITELAVQDYIFKGYGVDILGNINDSLGHRTVTIHNIPNNASNLYINSSDGINKTTQNLNFNATISDPDGEVLNVTLYWFNQTALHLVQDHNNSYANNTNFNATFLSTNIKKGENWSVGIIVRDSSSESSQVNTSYSINITNTPPSIPVLIDPDGNTTTDRTPTFHWQASTDDDGDTIQEYDINITLVAASTCVDAPIHDQSGGAIFYTPGSDLNCLFDNNDYYNWSVKAYDGDEYSDWASPMYLVNISSEIVISLPNATVQFGDIDYLEWNDTSDDSPGPLVIQNDGNSFVNITIGASNLWKSVNNPTSSYQFKVDNVSFNGENASFNADVSILDYTNIPDTGSPTICVAVLNYTNATDTAEIDINISVPADEGSSVRNSTVTFTASLGE